MKKKMLEFIKWFIMADAQMMNGDLLDYRTSCHEGDMPDDQINICKMENRDNWDDPVVLDSTNVTNIEYENATARVTIGSRYDGDTTYVFHRLYKEPLIEDAIPQVLINKIAESLIDYNEESLDDTKGFSAWTDPMIETLNDITDLETKLTKAITEQLGYEPTSWS